MPVTKSNGQLAMATLIRYGKPLIRLAHIQPLIEFYSLLVLPKKKKNETNGLCL